MLYTTRGDHSDRFLPFIAFLSVKANASLDGSFSSVHPGTVTSRMGKKTACPYTYTTQGARSLLTKN